MSGALTELVDMKDPLRRVRKPLFQNTHCAHGLHDPGAQTPNLWASDPASSGVRV